MDFAGLYGGYHADMTRTVAFGGPPELRRSTTSCARHAGGIEP